MIPQDETRHRLVRLLQLAYSGEKAAALAYQGHSRSVRDSEEKAMIAKIEQDEWVHREKVGRLLAQLEARPLRSREIRSSLVGHALSVLCRFTGWFLPMYLPESSRLKTPAGTTRPRSTRPRSAGREVERRGIYPRKRRCE